MTIEPTAVYSPGTSPAARGGYSGGRYYTIYNDGPPQPDMPGRVTRAWNRVPSQPVNSTIPSNMPSFLRANPVNNRSVVFNAWVIAMIVIGFDEWHNNNILPRPARLWDASLVYAVLVMLGFVDVMVPLANALAIGYTFMLIWQYYQGGLASGGSPQGATPVNAAPPTPSANVPTTQQLTGQ